MLDCELSGVRIITGHSLVGWLLFFRLLFIGILVLNEVMRSSTHNHLQFFWD